MPADVWGLGERLRALALAGNEAISQLPDAPSAWASVPAMGELDLSALPHLAALPRALAAAPALATLRLARCRGLRDIGAVAGMRCLATLDLSGVGQHAGDLLAAAGLAEGALGRLLELRLAGNGLRVLPRGLADGGCPALAALDLSSNALVDVSGAGLHRLAALTSLDLSNNALSGVPLELGSMTQLRILGLHGNPFRWPPLRALDKGPEEVKRMLRERAGVA